MVILHTFQDELSKLLDDVPRLPFIDFGDAGRKSPPLDFDDMLEELKNNPNYTFEPDRFFPTDTEIMAAEEAQQAASAECLTEELEDKTSVGPSMDDIAEYCLLKALLSKKLDLPILTNLFYKNFMLTVVPEGLELNIKKTKHKKLSNMLKAMQSEGLIGVEDNKGVQTLISVNHGHLMFKEMKSKFEELEALHPSAPPTSDDPGTSSVEIPTEIREDLVVNKLVSPLFAKSTYQ